MLFYCYVFYKHFATNILLLWSMVEIQKIYKYFAPMEHGWDSKNLCLQIFCSYGAWLEFENLCLQIFCSYGAPLGFENLCLQIFCSYGAPLGFENLQTFCSYGAWVFLYFFNYPGLFLLCTAP